MAEHKHSDESTHTHDDGSVHKEHAHEQEGEQEGHDHGGAHGHTHGTINPSILTSERGIWAVKWSFVGLFATTLIQIGVFVYSGSIALLADTIHNLGDACTAIPLAVAFWLARRKPSKRFTYGFGRVEDLAGVVVVATILASAIWAGYESYQRLFHPKPVTYLWAVAIAAIVGFIGNEGVAMFRIKVGKEMGSAALVADGYHARTDGFASLSVLLSAIGIWLGYPLADPIIGLLMTALILKIVWESAGAVFSRLLDGVDPEVVDEIEKTASHIDGVEDVTDVKVRWLGHRLNAELNIAVDPKLTVEKGHELSVTTQHELLHKLPFLSGVTIHLDPSNESGDEHHRKGEHAHDGTPAHDHE
ncbi:MAG: cation diffusion facilitator family transporter [Pyrinomonadaceae bacterium]